jgi:Na+-driven multidrug efflux pump
MFTAAALNALFDPILIFGVGPLPGFGLRGAAIANALAWTATSFYLLYALSHRERLLRWQWRGVEPLRGAWREHLRLSVPAAAANMMTPLATSVLTALVAGFGHEAVAAYGVGARLESFALLVVLALSTSVPPFVSQNLGAGRMDRVRAAVRLVMVFTLGWELLICALLVALRDPIVALYTAEPRVAHALALLLATLPLSYGLQGVVILCNSSFNALHEPRIALLLSAVRWFLCYVPCAALGAQMDGLRGLFIGAVIGNGIAAAIGWFWLSRHCERLWRQGGQGLVVAARPGNN